MSSEICRYTLGGFFLARYNDSPAGRFDEVGHFACEWTTSTLTMFVTNFVLITAKKTKTK